MESITEDPTNPTPWVNLGNLSRNAPNSGAGLMNPKRYYEKSWQVKPNYLAAFALGESAFKADDFLIAADWYQKAVSERPWDIDALYNRALSLLSAGRVNEARSACEELLEQYPNDRETKKLLRKCQP